MTVYSHAAVAVRLRGSPLSYVLVPQASTPVPADFWAEWIGLHADSDLLALLAYPGGAAPTRRAGAHKLRGMSPRV